VINRNSPEVLLNVIKNVDQIGDYSLYFNGSHLVYSAREILDAFQQSQDLRETVNSAVYQVSALADILPHLLSKSDPKSPESSTVEGERYLRLLDLLGSAEHQHLNLLSYLFCLLNLQVDSLEVTDTGALVFNLHSEVPQEERSVFCDTASNLLNEVAQPDGYGYRVSYYLDSPSLIKVELVKTGFGGIPLDDSASDAPTSYAPAKQKNRKKASGTPLASQTAAAPQNLLNSRGSLGTSVCESETCDLAGFLAGRTSDICLACVGELSARDFSFEDGGDLERQKAYDAIKVILESDEGVFFLGMVPYYSNGIKAACYRVADSDFFSEDTLLQVHAFLMRVTNGDYIIRSDRSQGKLTVKIKG